MPRAAVTACLILATALTAARSSTTTFRATVDLVHFGVVVVDKQGKPITGLKAEDFQVARGRQAAVDEILRRRAIPDDGAAAASRPAARHQRQHGGRHQGRRAPPRSSSSTRSTTPPTSRSWTSTPKSASRASAPTTTRAWSSASAGASPTAGPRSTTRSASISTAPQSQDGQKILVLYTDGGDTRSSLTFRDMLDLCKASDVTVYAIGYLEHQGSGRHAAADAAASAWPRLTGGQAFSRAVARSSTDLRQDRAGARRALQPRLPLDRPAHRRRLAQGRDQAEAARPERRQAAHPRPATSRPTRSSAR